MADREDDYLFVWSDVPAQLRQRLGRDVLRQDVVALRDKSRADLRVGSSRRAARSSTARNVTAML